MTYNEKYFYKYVIIFFIPNKNKGLNSHLIISFYYEFY